MAGKTDVEDSRTDAFVLHDIHDMRYQRSRLPGEGTAGFQNHLQPGIAATEILHHGDEQFHIIVLACHQMAAAEVDPFQLREPSGKFLLDTNERPLEHIRPTLAVAMAMEAFDIVGQLLRQLVGRHAESCAWRTGVIQQGLHLRVLRIDTKSDGHPLRPLMIALILRKRVKGQM